MTSPMTLPVQRSGDGSPLVLLHAFSFDARMWDPHLDRLLPTFDVVRYDQRGFGTAPDPHGPYSEIDDLWDVMAACDVAAAPLVGASRGGGLALEAALADPTRVTGLLLLGPTLPGGPGDPVFGRWWRDLAATAREESVAAALAHWLDHPLFTYSGRTRDAREQLAELTAAYGGFHWLHRDPVMPLQPPVAEQLRDIEVPVRIVVGEHETALFRRYADTMASQIPDADLVVVEGAGHMVGLDAPSIVSDLLADFAARHPGRHRTASEASARHQEGGPV
jgi:3-oxoadipate enol-lactonase